MRRKSLIHRQFHLAFRVYALEKQAILLAAEKSGLSVSDYMRRSCLGSVLTSRLSQEEIALYRMLITYRNNFARISNLVRDRKEFTEELKNVIQRIDHHLKKFQP